MSLGFVVCCVGSGLFDEPITHSEEPYRFFVCVFFCLIVCVLETSAMKRRGPNLG